MSFAVNNALRKASRTIVHGDRIFNVSAYGAQGDGIADDTAALNKAIAQVNTGGGRLFFPQGVYNISSSLTAIKPVHTDDVDSRRLIIDGDRATIRYTGSNPGSSIYLLDLTTDETNSAAQNSDLWYGWISGLTIEIDSSSPRLSNVNGIRIRRKAFFNVYDVYTNRLNVGLTLESCISCGFFGLRSRNNNTGVVAQNGTNGFSSCNEVAFMECHISNNQSGGISFIDGAFSFYGGTISGNGSAATSNAFGIKYQRTSSQQGLAPIPIKMFGAYTEGNGNATPGKADVWIDHDSGNASYVFEGVNFNRVGGGHCTNNILMEHAAGSVHLYCVGSHFENTGAYTPDAGRPYLNITGVGTARHILWDNYEHSATETPDISSLAATSNGKLAVANINLANLPTSAAGLNTGDIWNNSGVLNIA